MNYNATVVSLAIGSWKDNTLELPNLYLSVDRNVISSNTDKGNLVVASDALGPFELFTIEDFEAIKYSLIRLAAVGAVAKLDQHSVCQLSGAQLMSTLGEFKSN